MVRPVRMVPRRLRLARALFAVAALVTLGGGTCRDKQRFYQLASLTAAAPLTGPFYVLHAGNAHREDTVDGTWTALSPPQPGLRFGASLSADPFRPDTFYLAGTDLGSPTTEEVVLRSDDGGRSVWTRLTVGLPPPTVPVPVDRELRFVTADPFVRDRVWLGWRVTATATVPVLFRSDDRGATWTARAVGITGLFLEEVAADGQDPALLYARTLDAGVFRTADGGLTWAAFNPGLPLSTGQPRRLATDPSVARRVYALVGHELYRSDAGGAWVELPAVEALQSQVRGAPSLTEPSALAVDPTQPLRLYVGIEGNGLWVSEDGGLSFAPRSTGMELTSPVDILLDPATSLRAYVNGTTGIYRTEDGGLTWRLVPLFGIPPLVAIGV